jgi:hypothetical protein
MRIFARFVAAVVLTAVLPVGMARSQTGSPTALPAGGANGPSGAAAGGVSSSSAGSSNVGTTTGFSSTTRQSSLIDPSVNRRGFDASTNRVYFGDGTSARRFYSGMADDGTGGLAPGSAIPGRPNFSGGSTSGTLQPGGAIQGGPNTGDAFIDRNGPNVPAANSGLGPFNRFGFGINGFGVPVGNVVPGAVNTGTVVPQSGGTYVQPLIVPVPVPAATQTQTAQPAVQSNSAPDTEPHIDRGVATATAYPGTVSAGDTRADVVSLPPSIRRRTTPDVSEIPTGRGPVERRTGYRGVEATGEPTRAAVVYPGYTRWQGYYWYYEPSSGWHYWDGAAWQRFS